MLSTEDIQVKVVVLAEVVIISSMQISDISICIVLRRYSKISLEEETHLQTFSMMMMMTSLVEDLEVDLVKWECLVTNRKEVTDKQRKEEIHLQTLV